MTAGKPERLGYDSILLAYIAQHPDATKYQLSKNIRTEAHPKGVPYATISLWIKSLEKTNMVVARKLGPTRAGLTKIGYRITPSALFLISLALDTTQLLNLIRRHGSSLPISVSLIERAITSTGDVTGVIGTVTDIRTQDKKTSMDEYLGGLVMNDLWDLEFDDPTVQNEFVLAVMRAAAEINKSIISKRDFVSSVRELVDSESKYLENAAKINSTLKNQLGVLGRN